MKTKNKKQKKAQASLEYLSTYLWAGLALISAIGALTYLGAFDTEKFTEETCTINSQIQCLEAFTNTETIQLLIKNNQPFPIKINNINITEPFNHYENISLVITKNSKATININHSLNGTGTKKIIFKANYQRLRSELEANPQTPIHQISGEMIIKLKEKENEVPEQTNYCGNKEIDYDLGEECDPPTTITEGLIDSSPEGQNVCGTNNYCDSECKCQPITSRCGNGIIELGETCEKGEPLNTDCTTQGTNLIGTVECVDCEINYHCGPRPMIAEEILPDAIAGQSYDHTISLDGCDEECQITITRVEENIEGTPVWAPRIAFNNNNLPMLPLGLSFDPEHNRIYRSERAGPIPLTRYDIGNRPSNYRITFNITNPYGQNTQTIPLRLRAY